MPESIPAGYEVLQELDELDSLFNYQPRGHHIRYFSGNGEIIRGSIKLSGNPSLGVSLVTSAVKDALSLARTKGSSYLADDINYSQKRQQLSEATN